MHFRKVFIAVLFLLIVSTGSAQINSFVGAMAFPTIGKTRVYDGSMALGYGGGITYVFWEYKEWFIKSGAEFISRSSMIRDIPRHFEVPSGSELVLTDVNYQQQDLAIPIAVYYLPYEKKGNAVLVMGGMNVMYSIREKYMHDTYGSVVFSGEDIENEVKIGFTLGAGYQRELSNIMFLNVFPTFNMEIKANKPFTSIGLTVELIYGIY